MSTDHELIVPVPSLEKGGNGTVHKAPCAALIPYVRGTTMPGIDYDRLRREITMVEVLNNPHSDGATSGTDRAPCMDRRQRVAAPSP